MRRGAHADLKPENILISETGNIKLADFGFCKEVEEGGRKYTVCGTTDYMAPEVLLCQGHDRAADLWAFGIMIFELLAGVPPFECETDDEMVCKCLQGDIIFPSDFNLQARDLVKSLCKVDPQQRLGMDLVNKTEDIKAHPFFTGVEWSNMSRLLVKPPEYCKMMDVNNFRPKPDKIRISSSPPLSAEQQNLFSSF
ncbi:hypothetical protein CYMTET_23799 [Cymbomonas tetramitiformis]|uniref:Protein kinase domain-containing protein n=1 Tax=Cymbomonas tetramitiformis TaxID=36881 RepID=A0AAE0FX85_9CHLO|nr:hypothetical protein CYMTET_23799 [Cymbomonas tetramitiformis]